MGKRQNIPVEKSQNKIQGMVDGGRTGMQGYVALRALECSHLNRNSLGEGFSEEYVILI